MGRTDVRDHPWVMVGGFLTTAAALFLVAAAPRVFGGSGSFYFLTAIGAAGAGTALIALAQRPTWRAYGWGLVIGMVAGLLVILLGIVLWLFR